MMKWFLICLFSLLLTTTIEAQVLYFENFEGTDVSFELNSSDLGGVVGSSGTNRWDINNDYMGGSGEFLCLGIPFTFSVLDTPDQPLDIVQGPQSNCMHILSNSAANQGIMASSFLAADGICALAESNFSAMTDDLNTEGFTGVELSFWWLCVGGPMTYGEVYYSHDQGGSWNSIPGSGPFNEVSYWIQEVISDPVLDDQPSLRLAFRFNNQVTAVAADPAFSVDDIKLEASCQATSNSIEILTCELEYISESGETYTESGTYMETLVNADGCDSILTIDLSINAIDPNYVQVGEDLVALEQGLQYQWFLCTATLEPIEGATLSVYTPEESGSYALMVTDGICESTSSCQPFIISDITELYMQHIQVSTIKGEGFLIETDMTFDDLLLDVFDLSGRHVIGASPLIEGQNKVKLPGSSAMYLLRFNSGSETWSLPYYYQGN